MGKTIYLLKNMEQLQEDYNRMKKESQYKDSCVVEMDVLDTLIHKIAVAKRLDEIKAEPKLEKGSCIVYF